MLLIYSPLAFPSLLFPKEKHLQQKNMSSVDDAPAVSRGKSEHRLLRARRKGGIFFC